MCGIVGVLTFEEAPPVDLVSLEAATDLMVYRGPDDRGVEAGVQWGLGFRRLSILDLSPKGHQPMRTRDGSAWIIFNGEIYNYLDLRAELEAAGERFESTGDAEVLLYWLRRHGASGLARINGMFALAFLDLRGRKLLLARDRAGQKPLLYTQDREKFVFASTIKSVITAGQIKPEVDELALNQYFCFNYVPAPRTIFKDIKKLQPGHYLEVHFERSEEAIQRPYWQLAFDPLPGRSDAQWAEEVEDLLADAVARRLVSDVPVGTFLSGGLDSSLITALAVASHAREDLIAFTVGFDEQPWDESGVAASVAGRYHLAHCVTRLEPDALDVLPELVWHYEEPFADASAVPTYYLCKAASKEATVFLSGDGGDEIFAGYRRYLTAHEAAWLDRIPPPIRAALFSALAGVTPVHSLTHQRARRAAMPTWKRYATHTVFPGDPLNLFPLASPWRRSEEEITDFLYELARQAAHLDPLSRLQYLDFKLYLSNDILVKVDRASMAHSIEVRCPLLDYRLVELAARIPARQHLAGGRGKRIIRHIAEKKLPRAALDHKKHGFGVPLSVWFQGKTLDRIERYFSSSESRARGFYDTKAVPQLFAWMRNGRGRDLSHVLWRLLFFEAWCRQFLDGDTKELAGRAPVAEKSVM